MTVSSTIRRAGPYNGSGSSTAYAFSFKVFAASDLLVTRSDGDTETTLTLNFHYTVALNADQDINPGGSVTATIDVGETITITSAVPQTQPADIANQGGFYPRVIGDALDRTVILLQQQEERLSRTLRSMVGDGGISELPTAISRAGKFLAFDGDGDPIATENTPSATVAYQAAGVQARERTIESRFRDTYHLADYAACDGATDDAAAIAWCDANLPAGAQILVTRPTYFNSPLLLSGRHDWICAGGQGYFKLGNIGTLDDAITFLGGETRGGRRFRINLFNQAFNTCRNGLVFRQPFLCDIEAWIAVGGSAYNLEVSGPLESEIRLLSSVNYTTPLGSPYLAPNHMKVSFANPTSDPELGTSTGANGNRFLVKLAGRTNGTVVEDMGGGSQGTSKFSGLMQGMTGSPFQAIGCFEMTLDDFYVEGCDTAIDLTNCSNARINGRSFESAGLALNSCSGTTIEQWAGGLQISAGSRRTRVMRLFRQANDTIVDAAPDTEYDEATTSAASSTTRLFGGSSSVENMHPNACVDLWPAGTSAAPVGFSSASCTFSRVTSPVWSKNPAGTAAQVVSTAATYADACRIALPAGIAAVDYDRWMSFLVAVRSNTGQPDVTIQGYNGTTTVGGNTVTTRDAFVPVAFSIFVEAGLVPEVIIAPTTGGVVANGTFFVGSMAWAEGPSPPKSLLPGSARKNYVVTSVSHAPAFVGQMAVVGGAGYMATGVASSADWKQVTA